MQKRKLVWPQRFGIALVVLLSLSLIVGGLYAYFTDIDDNINVFTIGDVHIKAWEPAFPTEDTDGNGVPDECELLIPHETIPKDPRIKNTGTNDVVVFFKVTAPVELINVISDDGSRLGEKEEDLFYFKQAEDSEDTHQNHFDENWIELTTLDREIVGCAECNEEGKGFTYIFGYHTRLDTGEETSTLFDKVQNKKYGTRMVSANEVEQIRIEAYAVQADDIHRSGNEVNTSGTLTEEDLTYIYQVFINQNPAI